MTEVERLQRAVEEFNQARGWGPHHTPGALAAALSVEAAELQECFLWQDLDQQLATLKDADARLAVEEEIADVAIYLLAFCQRYGVDLAAAVLSKLARNEHRFPARGA